MEKIAICVPTFNRPLVIRELILKCCRYFENLDYDLYIYDSSDNDETWSVCKNLRLNYKFKYIHADRKIHSNEKVYKIYQDHNLLENYNYIWVWSDSIRWSEDILYKVKRTEDYDLVILNHRDKENIGDKIYNNPQQIFEDLAWEMTLYGSTIVNTDRILRGVQWNKYENAFLLSECINFSHICLYFERMMEVKNIKVLHYSIDSSEFTVSSLKEESGWYNNIFFIWWECWYNAINKLDGYINKEYVIRKSGIMSGYFTVKGMLILRQKGKYSLKVFIKYLERINYVTDISFFKMFLMASFRESVVLKKNTGHMTVPVYRAIPKPLPRCSMEKTRKTISCRNLIFYLYLAKNPASLFITASWQGISLIPRRLSIFWRILIFWGLVKQSLSWTGAFIPRKTLMVFIASM